MNLKWFYYSILFVLCSELLGQTNTTSEKTEVLTYYSAGYDPASEETQLIFKNSNGEKRIFYYSKHDEIKLEEQFFNKPVLPISELNLTKSELVGKKYKVTYVALAENSTPECCFKMKNYIRSK